MIALAEAVRLGLRPNRWPSRAVVSGVALLAVTAGMLLFLLVKLHNVADDYADRIKAGRRIEPFRLHIPTLDIELLAVRGEPATVETANPALAKLFPSGAEQRLFYVGQARGVAVLYDSRRQRVLYVPTAATVITTVNCETLRAQDDRMCKRAGTPLP